MALVVTTGIAGTIVGMGDEAGTGTGGMIVILGDGGMGVRGRLGVLLGKGARNGGQGSSNGTGKEKSSGDSGSLYFGWTMCLRGVGEEVSLFFELFCSSW